MTKWRLVLLCAVFLTATLVAQQRLTPPSAASLPTNCTIGDLATKTTDPAGLYVCTETDTWTIVGGGAGVPDGWTWDTDALTSEQITQPTFAQILELHPEITPTWAANSDLSYADDCVVMVNGGGKAFITEYFSGDTTGGSTPDWASAPNAGDTVSDGDITWIATAKTWATALATTPTTWTANHDYSPDVSSPVLIWPTTPNGHLYLAYPLPLTSDSGEPDFGTDFGNYTADNDGYWMDAGTLNTTSRSIVTDEITARTQLTVPATVDVPNETVITSQIVGGASLAGTKFTATSDASVGDIDSYVWLFNADFPTSANAALNPAYIGTKGSFDINATSLYGHYQQIEISGTLTNYYGFYDFGGPAETITNYHSFYASIPPTGDNYYGIYFTPSPSAGAIDNIFTVYSADLAGEGTNIYYEWFDSTGVRRVREDATFNSVGQAIEALYNPQFTKYTPGAANFERVILGQWNSNVAEIGTEKGGTGTLRNLRLIGEGLEFGAALVDPASSGTRFLCINTAGVVTSSASACSGT